MSLQTSKFVIAALQNDEGIMGKTKGRIYFVGRDNAAEEEDKIPYIVVMPEGVNASGTKDDDDEFDTDQISIMVVAERGEELMELAEMVRNAMKTEYYEGVDRGWSFVVNQFSFAAGAVQMDPMKPCYYQSLTYTIETKNK